jgi:hypothetical protein
MYQMSVVSLLCLLCTWSFVFSYDGPKFYVYDWPDLLDIYAKYTDRDIGSHGVEFPQWTENFGAGRLINAKHMEYKTSQFSLFKIMYEKAIVDYRRTDDPMKATSFLVPFDVGMHACFTHKHGRMRKTGCPAANEVMKRLSSSPYFRRHHGHDHTIIVSVNQNMNYFFQGSNCTGLFQLCWNCTKLAIDEYLFTAQDRTFELHGRGINWHAVPFPSDYHYTESLSNTGDGSSNHNNIPWWERASTSRKKHIISFSGSPKRLSVISTKIRQSLVTMCNGMNSTALCTRKHYNTGLSSWSYMCCIPPLKPSLITSFHKYL